jgi:hypothetical protein
MKKPCSPGDHDRILNRHSCKVDSIMPRRKVTPEKVQACQPTVIPESKRCAGGPVEVDEDVREAYWRDVRGLIDLSPTREGVMLKP